jgi:Uma2 family endonuclease
MATAELKKAARVYGPTSAGILMTPREFDRARFERGYRFELIKGVLVVSPAPLENQRDPNDELGFLLRYYKRDHPQGANLDATLPEHTINTGENRRVADRAIWVGLGRLPRRSDLPAIVIEFVSEGKRNIERDYEAKRAEFLGCGVKEYLIFDRFDRTLTVFQERGKRPRKRVLKAGQTYTTDLLPGFELALDPLFALADRWPTEE